MKTERRQELRTNELSQQVEHVSVYVQENAAKLAMILAGVVIVFVGGVWYFRSQDRQMMEAWAKLSPQTEVSEPTARIEVFKSVAAMGLNKDLTLAAWLKIGDASVDAMNAAFGAPATATKSAAEWQRQAEEAFDKVVTMAGKNLTAKGRALLGLAILAENDQNTAKAKDYYEKVVNDPLLKGTVFQEHAQKRLESLSARADLAVTFLPRSAPEPESTTQPTFDLTIPPVSGATTAPTVTLGEQAGQVLPSQAAVLPTEPGSTEPGKFPSGAGAITLPPPSGTTDPAVPTTQPAGEAP